MVQTHVSQSREETQFEVEGNYVQLCHEPLGQREVAQGIVRQAIEMSHDVRKSEHKREPHENSMERQKSSSLTDIVRLKTEHQHFNQYYVERNKRTVLLRQQRKQ